MGEIADAVPCTGCGEPKPLSAFYGTGKGKQGKRSICIACLASRAKASRIEAKAADPEGLKVRDAAANKRHRAKPTFKRASRRHPWRVLPDQPLTEDQLAAKAKWRGRTGILYTITLIADGRAYVGSTGVGFPTRLNQHLHSLRKGIHHGKYLQRCFSKYGEAAFAFEVIASGIPIADLIQAETDAIVRLRPVFNGDHPRATRLGSTQSAETIEKVRSKLIGRKHSPEENARKSRQMIGNTYATGNTNRRKVTPEIKVQIDELFASGLGCRRIAKIVSLDKATIQNVRRVVHNYG